MLQELQSGASEPWSQLVNLGAEGKLSQINLVDQLRYIWQRQELLTGGYLKLNTTGDVIVTIDASLADYEEKARVERALSKESLFPKGFGQFTMETEDGALYWVWNVNAQNYSWGVFVPLSEVMRIISETVPAVGELYLIDEEGRELYNINGSSIKTLEEIADETERVQETLNVAVDSKTKLNQESGKEKETDIRGEEQADIAGKNLYEDLPEKENYIYTVVIEGVDTRIVRAIPRTAVESGIPLAEKSVRNLALFALIIIPVLWISIKRLVLAPLSGLSKGMQEIQKDNIEYRIPESSGRVREFEYLDRSFNDMAEQIGKLRIAKYEAEIEKLDTEAINLRLQVNPHLLLNSLNMICNLAKLEELSTIQSYTMNMAEYFRYVLRRNEELVTLKAEMKFVECFLEMQKVRFPGSFVCVYNIEEGLEDFRIPPMLIQNFVENSIKYGLKMGEEIEILIIARQERVIESEKKSTEETGADREERSTRKQENAADGMVHAIGEEPGEAGRVKEYVVFSVVDTGMGMDEETLKKINAGEVITNRIGRHIGIWNVRRRLHLYYGEDVKMHVSSGIGAGTQVWIQIPMEGENRNESVDRG